jgi:hypothetical protein
MTPRLLDWVTVIVLDDDWIVPVPAVNTPPLGNAVAVCAIAGAAVPSIAAPTSRIERIAPTLLCAGALPAASMLPPNGAARLEAIRVIDSLRCFSQGRLPDHRRAAEAIGRNQQQRESE